MAVISQYQVVIAGQTITAALWNAMELNIINNGLIPTGIEDISSNDSAMQTTVDPYPSAATSKATDLAGEIQRIRYQLDLIIGLTYWYEDPSVSLEDLDTHDHSAVGAQIVTAGIADNAVTNAKLDSNAVIPTGTKMCFYQANAPTGWTAVAVNDKFLRVVSAGGTGGSTGGSGHAPSDTISLEHTHSTPAHLHVLEHQDATSATLDTSAKIGSNASSGHELYQIIAGGTTLWHVQNVTETSGAGTTGSAGSDAGFQYADVIIATRD